VYNFDSLQLDYTYSNVMHDTDHQNSVKNLRDHLFCLCYLLPLMITISAATASKEQCLSSYTRCEGCYCVDKLRCFGCTGELCGGFMQGSWAAGITDDFGFLANQNVSNDKMANNRTILV